MKIGKKAETLEAVYIYIYTLSLLKIKNGINKSGIRNKVHPL